MADVELVGLLVVVQDVVSGVVQHAVQLFAFDRVVVLEPVLIAVIAVALIETLRLVIGVDQLLSLEPLMFVHLLSETLSVQMLLRPLYLQVDLIALVEYLLALLADLGTLVDRYGLSVILFGVGIEHLLNPSVSAVLAGLPVPVVQLRRIVLAQVG